MKIELKGGSFYVPQEKEDAFRVVSGSVYVYIVPWHVFTSFTVLTLYMPLLLHPFLKIINLFSTKSKDRIP